MPEAAEEVQEHADPIDVRLIPNRVQELPGSMRRALQDWFIRLLVEVQHTYSRPCMVDKLVPEFELSAGGEYKFKDRSVHMPSEKLYRIATVLMDQLPERLDERGRRGWQERAGIEASQVSHEIVHSVKPVNPEDQLQAVILRVLERGKARMATAGDKETVKAATVEEAMRVRDTHEGLVEAENREFAPEWLRRTGLGDPDVLRSVQSVFSYATQKLLADRLVDRAGGDRRTMLRDCGRLGNSEAAVARLSERLLTVRDRGAVEGVAAKVGIEMRAVHVAWKSCQAWPFEQTADDALSRVVQRAHVEARRLRPLPGQPLLPRNPGPVEHIVT